MERCHGTTKSGQRCKRSAPEGSLYCGLHADQAPDGPDAARASAEEAGAGEATGTGAGEHERDLLDAVFVVAAAGLALVAALAFRRIFRIG